jgi:pantothenate kinase-related protein Tda10
MPAGAVVVFDSLLIISLGVTSVHRELNTDSHYRLASIILAGHIYLRQVDVKEIHPAARPFVIAIGGPSGSGKSTPVNRTASLLGDAITLFFDD